MLKKLSKQLGGEDWTWNNLNTLCWAIGSISGSMVEEQVGIYLYDVFFQMTFHKQCLLVIIMALNMFNILLMSNSLLMYIAYCFLFMHSSLVIMNVEVMRFSFFC